MNLIIINYLKDKLGVDGAIGYTILTRVIQASGGLVTLLFIALFLSNEEQGYYYTFGSIIAIQVFFELGLNSIITQYVAHEVAHLRWNSDSELTGSDQHLSRLSSLLHFCTRVYVYLAIILFVVLEISGYVFFTKFNSGADSISWQSQWMLVAFTTSLMFLVNPVLAFVEGLGKVKEVAQLRFFQQIANLSVIALVFALGGKLWALGIASLVSFLILFFGIVFSYRKKILIFIYKSQKQWRVNYYKEILPYQWRIAVSWISGYFIFQLFNPVLFAIEGAVIAGQMGMTLVALGGISSLSMSWVSTKVPVYSAMIAQSKYAELDILFNKTIRSLLGLNALLLAGFFTSVKILGILEFGFVTRFLTGMPLLILCLVSFANQFLYSWATYLRCHKKEPFLFNSVLTGILCAMSTLILGNIFGLGGIVYGYGFITLLIALPWGYLIFKRKKQEWHL